MGVQGRGWPGGGAGRELQAHPGGVAWEGHTRVRQGRRCPTPASSTGPQGPPLPFLLTCSEVTARGQGPVWFISGRAGGGTWRNKTSVKTPAGPQIAIHSAAQSIRLRVFIEHLLFSRFLAGLWGFQRKNQSALYSQWRGWC